MSFNCISSPSATNVLVNRTSPPLINTSDASFCEGTPKLFVLVAKEEPKTVKELKLLLVPVPRTVLSTTKLSLWFTVS